MPVKKLFDVGQREVISVFSLVTNKGEHSIIIIKQCKQKMWNYFVKLVRKRIKHRYEGKTGKSQTPAGKISIGLQLGGASLETRNLSLGCLRFFRLALLPVLDSLYLLTNETAQFLFLAV